VVSEKSSDRFSEWATVFAYAKMPPLCLIAPSTDALVIALGQSMQMRMEIGSVANFDPDQEGPASGHDYAASSAKVWNAMPPLAGICPFRIM
jgi:hypothetical protein